MIQTEQTPILLLLFFSFKARGGGRGCGLGGAGVGGAAGGGGSDVGGARAGELSIMYLKICIYIYGARFIMFGVNP